MRRPTITWRRPRRLVRIRQRRLVLGRTPPERALGPTRASPGREGLRSSPFRSAFAWQRPDAFERADRRWGRTPRASGLSAFGVAIFSSASLSACLATASPHSAPSFARAGAGPVCTQEGSRPDLGFAWWRVASPSSLPNGPCLAAPSPPGAPQPRRPVPGRTPHECTLSPTRASLGREMPYPPQRRSALAWRRLRGRSRLCSRRPVMGRTPPLVGYRPDPGFARLRGAASSLAQPFIWRRPSCLGDFNHTARRWADPKRVGSRSGPGFVWQGGATHPHLTGLT